MRYFEPIYAFMESHTLHLGTGKVTFGIKEGSLSGLMTNWVCEPLQLAWVNGWLFFKGKVWDLRNVGLENIYYTHGRLSWFGQGNNLVVAELGGKQEYVSYIPIIMSNIKLDEFIRFAM